MFSKNLIDVLTGKVVEFVGKTNRVYICLETLMVKDGIQCHVSGLMHTKESYEMDLYINDSWGYNEVAAAIEIMLLNHFAMK
jgi:hypothetical protein